MVRDRSPLLVRMLKRLRYAVSPKNPHRLCRPGSPLRLLIAIVLSITLLTFLLLNAPTTGRITTLAVSVSVPLNCSFAAFDECTCWGATRNATTTAGMWWCFYVGTMTYLCLAGLAAVFWFLVLRLGCKAARELENALWPQNAEPLSDVDEGLGYATIRTIEEEESDDSTGYCPRSRSGE